MVRIPVVRLSPGGRARRIRTTELQPSRTPIDAAGDRAAGGLPVGRATAGGPATEARPQAGKERLMSMSWSPLQPTRHRRPARWLCRTCQATFTGRAHPQHEHEDLVPLCAYAERKNPVRRIGLGCCEDHGLLAIRAHMRLPPGLTPAGATTGLAIFAARKGRYSRGELADKLRINWRTLYWIEVRDEDFSRERWAARVQRLLTEGGRALAGDDAAGKPLDGDGASAGPAPIDAISADGLDAVLQEAVAELERVSAARPHLSPDQIKALLSNFVAGFTHRAARLLGELRA